MKRLLCFCMTCTLLLGMTANVHAETKDSTETIHYEYPIVPGTEAWSELTTHQQMIEAVQIPEDILNKMNTEELVTAVLENPMIIDIYAYYTVEDGFTEGYRIMCDKLNCLNELSKRGDSAIVLEKALSNLSTVLVETEESGQAEDVQSMYMTGNRILQCIEEQSTSEISESMISPLAAITTVYTPNGSAVSVYSNTTWADHGITSTEGSTLANQYVKAYPNATKIASQSPVYNCHNYAWNKSNPTKYWMNNPSKYMSDGSYSETGTAASGYKVYYPSGNHSAIIISNNDDNIYVKSKWGAMPVFSHNVHYSPYDDTGITFWK